MAGLKQQEEAPTEAGGALVKAEAVPGAGPLAAQAPAVQAAPSSSGLLAGMQAQQDAEKIRQSQPSPIPGHVQGTYEKVVKDPELVNAPPMSDKQKAAWKQDAHNQLSTFGDYFGKGDPAAPPPPIRPMGRSFNPFTGKFTGRQGLNAFKIAGVDLEKYKTDFFRKGSG